MADTVGNRLGPRGTYLYESDAGVTYNISLDDSVATAVGNTLSTNAAFPVLKATQRRPLSPRYILTQLVSDPSVTKRIIVGDATNALWTSSAASTVTINGVAYTVTGRVGEKRSALKIGDPTP